MKQEERDKQLNQLANSAMGEALKEHFQEKIDGLIDARNYKEENFETEGKTSLKAAKVLEKIIKELGMKKKGEKKEKNEYL